MQQQRNIHNQEVPLDQQPRTLNAIAQPQCNSTVEMESTIQQLRPQTQPSHLQPTTHPHPHHTNTTQSIKPST